MASIEEVLSQPHVLLNQNSELRLLVKGPHTGLYLLAPEKTYWLMWLSPIQISELESLGIKYE